MTGLPACSKNQNVSSAEEDTYVDFCSSSSRSRSSTPVVDGSLGLTFVLIKVETEWC